MDIQRNSIIDTVIEYANVKFGVEMNPEQLGEQLKQMKFSETLKLVDAIKNEDDTKFSEIIDMSASVEEAGYGSAGTNPGGARAADDAKQGAVAARRANIAGQDAARDGTAVGRTTAGSAISPTGTGGGQGGGSGTPDPDDMERADNAANISSVQQQAQNNSAEIERLKQLSQGR